MTTEIRKTIIIDAPPSRVFKALTEENELNQWYSKEAKFNARIGSEFTLKMHWASRGLDFDIKGDILELIPNKKLSYTWKSVRLTDTQETPIITWLLEPLTDGKTRVTVIQTSVTKEFWQDTETGWSHFLSQLANHCKQIS